MNNPLFTFFIKHWLMLLATILVSIVTYNSGCSSDSGYTSTPVPSNSGWITIGYPEDDVFTAETSPQYLSGEAFISPTAYYNCCSGDAIVDTGVTITWTNETTGQSAQASQHAEYCWFFGPQLCGHTWSASIPVIDSTNQIIISATDSSGNVGRKSITIIRPPDSTPPIVSTTYPGDGETGVDIDAPIIARFNESIEPNTVTENSFTIRNYAGDLMSGAINVSTGGTDAIFYPSPPLALNGTYTATLTTEITDIAGVPMSALYSWTFETGSGDTEPPQVVSTQPPQDGKDVSLYEPVTVIFNESMSSASINSSTFLLFDANNNPVTGTVEPADNSATFSHLAPLSENSLYTAVITTGVLDAAGNAMVNEYRWSFTTTIPDTTAPTVSAVSPISGATGVAVDGAISVMFDEGIDPATVNTSTFLLKDSSGSPIDGNIFKNVNSSLNYDLWPSFNLGLEETYTAAITTGVTDYSGNPLSQTYSWSFTTTGEGVGSWTETSTTGAPSPRKRATAVWSGQEMIVWGGDNGSYLNSGGRYNPITDSWQPMSSLNAPYGCSTPLSVWTGKEMIVWCGSRGGRYNPLTDSWTTISTTNAPPAVNNSTAVWSGEEMIVWGGYGSTYSNSGGRYNPVSDIWQATTLTGAPSPRLYHTAVWSGSHMLIWGGFGAYSINLGNTGGSYDPATDSWSAISSTGAPDNDSGHIAQWSGTSLLVWGGNANSGSYDPQTDSWSAIGTTDTLIDRSMPYSAWTGEKMIVWGGTSRAPALLTSGGSYTPTTDNWSITAFNGAPTGREYGVNVWTGTEFIVWGGQESSGALTNTGGRYTPP